MMFIVCKICTIKLKTLLLSVKALSGLQFLLNRVRILQERGCKLSISGMPLIVLFTRNFGMRKGAKEFLLE